MSPQDDLEHLRNENLEHMINKLCEKPHAMPNHTNPNPLLNHLHPAPTST